MEAKPESDVATEAVNVLNECVKLASNIQSIVPPKKSKEPRRNDDKSSEQMAKFLNSNHTPEEKLAVISKKYFDVVDENRKFQVLSKQWEKKYVMMQREKDQTQQEYNKAILLKSKLENLCRELQKQIKVVKEESILKIKEEEEKRKENMAIFQHTITELTTAVQQNNEKNAKLRDTNQDIKEKFKTVMEQYELRENHVDKITKQMALETQLNEAKLAKARLEAQAERERLLAEKKQLLNDLTQYKEHCNELQQNSVNLQSQVAMYTDKYDEFQTLLTKSSEVFGGVKGEMEKVSKQVEKQEKEANVWKVRWEKSHVALLDMASEKQKMDAMFALQEKKLYRLQNMCRTMQAQRTVLLSALKDNNIETPALPQAPPPEPEKDDKVEILAANCAQLKQSLSLLQGQLNDITDKKKNESTTETSENSSQKKQKKGKGKKNKNSKEMNEPSEESQNVENAKSESIVTAMENHVESLMKNVNEILPITVGQDANVDKEVSTASIESNSAIEIKDVLPANVEVNANTKKEECKVESVEVNTIAEEKKEISSSSDVKVLSNEDNVLSNTKVLPKNDKKEISSKLEVNLTTEKEEIPPINVDINVEKVETLTNGAEHHSSDSKTSTVDSTQENINGLQQNEAKTNTEALVVDVETKPTANGKASPKKSPSKAKKSPKKVAASADAPGPKC